MKITIPETTITIPKMATILRSWKWGLLAALGVGMLAVVLTFTWGYGGPQRAQAGAPTWAEMSVTIDGVPDKACTGVPGAKPLIEDGAGVRIDVCVEINKVGPPPGTGYSGWAVVLDYDDESWQIDQLQPPEIFGTCDIFEPPVKKEVQGDGARGHVAFGCQNFPGIPKTELGPVAAVTFISKKKGNLTPEQQEFRLLPKGSVQQPITGSSVECETPPFPKQNCDIIDLVDGGVTVNPQPVPTNTPEVPKALDATCIAAKDDFTEVECKALVGEPVHIGGTVDFGQDLDPKKDGIAGWHSIAVSAHWPPGLEPLKNSEIFCPPGSNRSAKMMGVGYWLQGCLTKQPAGEAAGPVSFVVTLNCTEVGSHVVDVMTLIAREDDVELDPKTVQVPVDCNPVSQVNITNLGQYALPKTCFEVRDDAQNPLFTVCDNDFQGPPESDPVCITDGVCEDEDPTEGFIRVTVAPDDYTVVETKVPYNHTGDSSKLDCAAVAAGKCELTFVNTPGNMPWFPWDINGDGVVTVFDDIIGVANHFGERKEVPTP